MEQRGGRTNSEPPLTDKKHSTYQDGKKKEPAADSAGEDGLESDERSQRQNTFTSLQDEVHKKRVVGMRCDG